MPSWGDMSQKKGFGDGSHARYYVTRGGQINRPVQQYEEPKTTSSNRCSYELCYDDAEGTCKYCDKRFCLRHITPISPNASTKEMDKYERQAVRSTHTCAQYHETKDSWSGGEVKQSSMITPAISQKAILEEKVKPIREEHVQRKVPEKQVKQTVETKRARKHVIYENETKKQENLGS